MSFRMSFVNFTIMQMEQEDIISKVKKLRIKYIIDWKVTKDDELKELVNKIENKIKNMVWICCLTNDYYYFLNSAEKYIEEELSELPEWIIRIEEWVKMQKIKEIIK